MAAQPRSQEARSYTPALSLDLGQISPWSSFGFCLPSEGPTLGYRQLALSSGCPLSSNGHSALSLDKVAAPKMSYIRNVVRIQWALFGESWRMIKRLLTKPFFFLSLGMNLVLPIC